MKLKKLLPFPIKYFKKDIIAGMSVAFILIPQSMAYASLAGLPIYVGLYTACIPVIVAALFGSSKQMSTGPVTIVSLMTATALGPIASVDTQGYIIYASLLALFIGIFYIILGMIKMGILVEFLSHPVITGFTNAIAILTLTSQLPKIFGFSIEKGGSYIDFLSELLSGIISDTHLMTLVFGIGAIAIMLVSRYISPRIPRVLVTLIISIIASYLIRFSELGGSIIGHIPQGLPSLSIPFLTPEFDALSMGQIIDLIIFSVIIGLIGFTESVSVAKLVATQTKQKVRANRELIGQGLANISSGFFGGYAVAGSFSKTAVNLRAGARTSLSSIVTGLLVCITLVFFTPFLYHLPSATLAAVIIVSVTGLIRIAPLKKSFQIEPHDGIIGVITFLATLIMAPNIEGALGVGILLSLGFFIYRTMKPKIMEVARYKDGMFRHIDTFGLKGSKKISAIKFDGDLYFANAGYFEDQIMEMVSQKEKLKFLIIDLSSMTNMDSSGYEVFEKIIERFEKVGIHIYLSSLKVGFIEKFTAVGFMKKFGNDHIFSDIESALQYIKEQHDERKEVEKLDEFTPDKNKKPDLEKDIKKAVKEITK